MKVQSPYVKNFLHRGSQTALIVVRVGPQGIPDSVSYWENSEHVRIERHDGAYEAGALVDMWI